MRGGTAVFSRDRHFEFYIRVLAEIENSLNFERLYHPSTKYSAKTCTVKRAYWTDLSVQLRLSRHILTRSCSYETLNSSFKMSTPKPRNQAPREGSHRRYALGKCSTRQSVTCKRINIKSKSSSLVLFGAQQSNIRIRDRALLLRWIREYRSEQIEK